jgi:histidine triad (HIT) family protein
MMAPETDCTFCRIAAGEFGTEFLYESENVVAFNDLSPVAGTHVLVIPRRHLASVAELGPEDNALLGEVISAANKVAVDRGIVESGYRILTNHGKDAGQTVFHLHVHLLGGNELAPLG